jgi:hypothetical protein
LQETKSLSVNWWFKGICSTNLQITHVLFDMDGLLLDTEGFYTKVQQDIVSKFGKEFSWNLKARMMGKKAIESARLLVKELQLEGLLTAEEFLEQREAALDALFPTAELMPGNVPPSLQHQLQEPCARGNGAGHSSVTLVKSSQLQPQTRKPGTDSVRVADRGGALAAALALSQRANLSGNFFSQVSL